jgi:hypothetical protein
MGNKKETIECAEYDSLVNGIEAAKAKVAEAGKAAVGALFKSFFAEYPSVKAVGWTQYTPYFNDGEACNFGLRELYLSTKEADFSEVASLYDEEEYGFKDSCSLKGSLGKALRRLEASMNSEVFEAAFGDHVLVVATPEGFHVGEYSHD